MKIFGDTQDSPFKIFKEEPGIFWGHNDVVQTEELSSLKITSLGPSDISTFHIKVYIHKFHSQWSKITGFLREYLLPWRWKVAYIDSDGQENLERVLACTSAENGELSDRLKMVIGKPEGIVQFIKKDLYVEHFGQEFLRLPIESSNSTSPSSQTINHPLGKCFGYCTLNEEKPMKYSHIYRIQGIFSYVIYNFLKYFSSEWKEETLLVKNFSETMLVRQKDLDLISKHICVRQ